MNVTEKFVVQKNLDEFKQNAIDRAERGACDGGCDEHIGTVRCVRVYDPEHKTDWGWFSYCDAAIEEDTRRGMGFVFA